MRLVSVDQAADVVEDIMVNVSSREAQARLVGVTNEFYAGQSTACNAIHSVEQRVAHWLLMAQDRMGSDQFPLTQTFVAMMLGASRPTVTVVAGTLHRPA